MTILISSAPVRRPRCVLAWAILSRALRNHPARVLRNELGRDTVEDQIPRYAATVR